MERHPQKNVNGRRPQFVLKKYNKDLPKKWTTTSIFFFKLEDDLKKTRTQSIPNRRDFEIFYFCFTFMCLCMHGDVHLLNKKHH